MSKTRDALIDPLFNNNPIALQVLGICSALAVTTRMDTALVMSAAVVFVLLFPNNSPPPYGAGLFFALRLGYSRIKQN